LEVDDHSFDKDYWDQVWHGDRAAAMGSAPPNPHLVEEVSGLVVGTALEAGCGAGAEAIWLATRGWRVTGADVAAEALTRAAERAAVAGVAARVQWVEADLSTWEPDSHFDLVTTHYAHPAIPQLQLYDRLASWVAPGGTLFVVGHLHGAGHGHGHDGPPASASVRAADVAGRLDPDLWEVSTAREPRRAVTGPDGREVTLQDVVVRATRRA
jgi:SAM-dependent methyltransferase